MSKGQLEVVVARLVKIAGREFRDDRSSDGLDRCRKLLYSLRYGDERRRWFKEDLHPAMLPLLLAPAGYEAKPAKPPARESHAIAYTAVPLLAELRKNGDAAALDRIAADENQNTATRLGCLLALYGAGERLHPQSLVPLLKSDHPQDERVAAALALSFCSERKATVARLVELLDDPSEEVRRAAVVVLVDRPAREALPKLRKLLAEGKAEQSPYHLLRAIAHVGTREARAELARFLEAALADPKRSRQVYHALSAFETATGERWTGAGAHQDAYYRGKAEEAIAWWKKQKD
jgi:hypothetical protein